MLFNKNGNGTAELRKHAGFLYASVDYENIEPDVVLATGALEDLIGSEVMEEAYGHYNSANYLKKDTDEHKLLDELVAHIQLPITLLAVQSFQILTDLAHNEDGRKMKVAEGEKIAWEWMIERDDQALLSRAYKTIDRLLAFLDKHIDDSPIDNTWGTSEAYLNTKKLFVNSVKEFSEVFPIDSRRFFLLISPMMADRETAVILPIIGKDRFDTLKEKIKDKDLEEADKKLLNEIKAPLVLSSMAIAVERLAAEVLPNGIFQNFISAPTSKKPAPDKVRSLLISHFEKAAAKASTQLQNYITSISEVTEEESTPIDYSSESFFRF
jgi:hypothetical protein